jgi:hypothetical protein
MWEPSTSVLPTEGSLVAKVIGRIERVPVFVQDIIIHISVLANFVLTTRGVGWAIGLP